MTNPSQRSNLHRVTTSQVLFKLISLVFTLLHTCSYWLSKFFHAYLFISVVHNLCCNNNNNYSSNMFSSPNTPPSPSTLLYPQLTIYLFFFFSPCQLSRRSSLSSPPLPSLTPPAASQTHPLAHPFDSLASLSF